MSLLASAAQGQQRPIKGHRDRTSLLGTCRRSLRHVFAGDGSSRRLHLPVLALFVAITHTHIDGVETKRFIHSDMTASANC